MEHLLNQPMLETSVGSHLLLSDSMTIGELTEQKQQRNRTVVIDVAVCTNVSFVLSEIGVYSYFCTRSIHHP